MKILRNYVLKEITAPLIASIGVFTFVLLIGNMFKLADLLVNKGVEPQDVLKFFIYLIPYILSYTTPMALLTATMLCFGRLASDNEITAIRASGISLYKIGLPVIMVAFIISLASVYLNDRILPLSHFASYRLVKEVGMKKPTAYLEPGTFIKSFKGYIVFIHGINGDELKNIRIYQTQEGAPTRTIIAQSGTIKTYPSSNTVELDLRNGTLDEPNPDNPQVFYKLNFKTYNMKLNLADSFAKYQVEKKPKDMTVKELEEDISKFKKDGIDTTPLLVEIHRKIAMAFSGFVMVLIGLPIAINTRRREKSIGFGMSLIILTLYYLLFIGGEALSLRHILPPIMGLWLANALYFAAGIILIFIIVEK